MIQLVKTLQAWKTPAFKETLKDEIAQLDIELLPLQQGLSQGDHAIGENLSVMIICVSETPDLIRAKTGIFYTSVIAGCSCADDPTPIDEYNEYCEVQFNINKLTAETTASLNPE